MQRFRADLHIHSRFSRATSSKLNPSHLAAWGKIKGLSVLGTGDFTHPAWRAELRAALLEDESTGLYRLRAPAPLEAELPEYGPLPPGEHNREPLFMLQAEISSIYKKDGAVRKVHNLVYMPDFDSAERLCRKLASIGNLNADGRPILGLDSRLLLEIVLETDNRGVLIPAHIWTPWFSLFGSRSGFDTLEACFGDLSRHIFALETGLSSDPAMNRMWSALDRYALISNSDCHSGENLGREANVFEGLPSYDGIFEALRRAAGSTPPRDDCRFLGTLEFFPEEGKYHLDGHRACNVVLEPEEARALNNICPVCHKPLTIGVLHRVRELADRALPLPPSGDPGFASLIPLPELLGELLGTGAKSVKVRTRHSELLGRFGDELSLLMDVPEAELRGHWDTLGEAVARMRRGDVIRHGGYDGEYGVVRVFNEQEQKELLGGKTRRVRTAAPARTARPREEEEMEEDALFTPPPVKKRAAKSALARQGSLLPPTEAAPRPRQARRRAQPQTVSAAGVPPQAPPAGQAPRPAPGAFAPAVVNFTIPQLRAIKAGPQPVLVMAGPGSGKTRTLIGRIAHLLEHGVLAERVVAVTFTRRAAAELHERLVAALPAHTSERDLPQADTLHALALRHWPGDTPLLLGEDAARAAFASANPQVAGAALRGLWDALNLCRERLQEPDEGLRPLHERYTAWKQERGQADYSDLLETWLTNLATGQVGRFWTEVLVDEMQDLSPLQLRLIRALLPADGQGFFGIGDPDQAIYGFRGALPDTLGALRTVWPELDLYTLSDSHRAGPGILDAASAVLGATAVGERLHAARPLDASLHLFSAPDARKEANWVADRVAGLIGWGGHTELDRAQDDHLPLGPCSPGEIAVLVRTRALIPALRDALERKGIPCAYPEAAPFWSDPGAAVLLALAAAHFDVPVQQAKALHLARPLPVPLPIVPEAYWQGQPDKLHPLLEGFPALGTLAGTPALKALTAAWKTCRGWPGLLDMVLLGQAMDLLRTRAEQVQIMTLHASKGLEFRAVFLPALEEGLLPFFGADALLQPQHAASALPHVAEERRLLYVGITRASEAVFVSHAAKRTLYGRELALSPSRFLQQLPENFRKSRLVRHSRVAVKQISLLD